MKQRLLPYNPIILTLWEESSYDVSFDVKRLIYGTYFIDFNALVSRFGFPRIENQVTAIINLCWEKF